MHRDPARFRLLLAEDDPVSREFLCAAVGACGATVAGCADGRSALARARSEHWDLLIFDHHLPDLDGDAVLAALRADPNALSRTAPAIATSAAREEEMARLLRAGFLDVLPKPMTARTLRTLLHQHGCVACGLLLDDDDALRACGSPEAFTMLRRLFSEQELPRVQDELERLAGDPQALRPMLHRLRASCGFCGAHALAEASAALHRALETRTNDEHVEVQLAAFRRSLAETRAALHASLESNP